MRILKIHRAISFYQSAFLEPYITYNSQRRANAVNSFEKDYYKLKNNALFGKTMENVRTRRKFRLANAEEKLITLASRPEFLESVIFTEDLVGICLAKDRIVLDKPIYIGQAVLELSKLEMYELRYCTLPRYESEFGGTIRVLGGDTDSFILSISDIRVDTHLLPAMCRDGLLDTSNYPPSHPLFSNTYKARLGCIKDEAAGKPFFEIILLRPKAYSLRMADPSLNAIRRAKGVRRCTLMSEIGHDDYVSAYKFSKEFSHTQRRIGSRLHQLYTMTYAKRTLSSFDDKRYWLEANKSVPFGHHRYGLVPRPIKRKAFVPPIMLG